MFYSICGGLQHFFQYRLRPCWSIDYLKEFQSEIVAFKQKCLHVFHSYRSSGLGTFNLNAFDHLVDDLRDFGNIHCLHAGLY